MPSIPQSLLWISLVVLWLFVLVPMLISKRDTVRRTSDVALATRVLNTGRGARLLRRRSGPAAGHYSDPDWRPSEDRPRRRRRRARRDRRGRPRRRAVAAARRAGRRRGADRTRLPRRRRRRDGLGRTAGRSVRARPADEFAHPELPLGLRRQHADVLGRGPLRGRRGRRSRAEVEPAKPRPRSSPT